MTDPAVPTVGTPARLCLGLMSGTSADGIDAALVEITGAGPTARLRPLAFVSVPYPDPVRDALLALYDGPPDAVARLCSLGIVVGECFAGAALAVCEAAGVAPAEVAVIGSHGQTVWHEPIPDPASPLGRVSTLQIGDPATIAARTGIPTVADFRAADIAAGGQGAPLAPYFDWSILRHPERARAVQNIGGIANVTAVPAAAGRDDVVAFDTGPGNILIDATVEILSAGRLAMDRDGALAAAGRVDYALLGRLLDDPYLHRPPPKTTGRERYGLAMARDLVAAHDLAAGDLDGDLDGDLGSHPVGGTPVGDRRSAADARDPDDRMGRCRDLVATVTALTARSITDAYRRWLPPIDEVIVSGGGARNPTLMAALADLLAPTPVMPLETHGFDGDAKEAIFFALLANDALAGLPTNVPSATGANRAVPLGSLTLAPARSGLLGRR